MLTDLLSTGAKKCRQKANNMHVCNVPKCATFLFVDVSQLASRTSIQQAHICHHLAYILYINTRVQQPCIPNVLPAPCKLHKCNSNMFSKGIQQYQKKTRADELNGHDNFF